MKAILTIICLAFAACSTPNGPQVSEVGSAVGGSYTNPKTGEQYSGQASSYVKLAPKSARPASDPKQVLPPTYAK